MEIDKKYIDWLQENYPDADHTKDLTRDYLAQESKKKIIALYTKVRSEYTAVARGSEDSYDEWRENGSWSDYSRLIRG